MSEDFFKLILREASASDRRAVYRALYPAAQSELHSCCEQLQQSESHMAIVLDEYGGTLGHRSRWRTFIEELVGEIWDEHDEVTEDFRQQSDGSWLVAGSASVDDLFETLDLPEDEDIDSTPSTVWCRRRPAICPRWATISPSTTLRASSPARPAAG